MKTASYYLRGVSVKNRTAHFHPTDAAFKLDWSFLKKSVVPVFKIMMIVYLARLGQLIREEHSVGKIAFSPQPVGPWYTAWGIVQLAGLRITNNPAKADYTFVFDDVTHSSAHMGQQATADHQCVNHNVTDISKGHVATVFEEVFGYALAVDPTQHAGPIVRKSEKNGVHDGVILQGPLSRAEVLPGYVYQRYVDSMFDGKTTEDLRISFVFGDVPVVFHKHKQVDKHFGTDYLSVDLRDAQDVFTDEELALIQQFGARMGLDYGAIDVMRDRHSGRIYIVDLNKTCMPVLCLTYAEQRDAFQRIAAAFRRGLTSR